MFFIIRSLIPFNVIHYRWAVSNFSSHSNFRKFQCKSDSSLGICQLGKKIFHVLIFYILSHVVSGFLTFSDGPLTGKIHRKSYIFQSTPSSYLISLCGFMHFSWFYIKKIILSGTFETNPGRQSKRCQEFSICHWNLNSIATHSFVKFSLLKVYATIYNSGEPRRVLIPFVRYGRPKKNPPK